MNEKGKLYELTFDATLNEAKHIDDDTLLKILADREDDLLIAKATLAGLEKAKRDRENNG